MTTYDQFLESIDNDFEPSDDISLCLKALWWVKKGDWEKAHDLAQEEGTVDGDWVHAYLHRYEGDIGNAAYWYNRAGKPVKKSEDLDEEWMELVKIFIN